MGLFDWMKPNNRKNKAVVKRQIDQKKKNEVKTKDNGKRMQTKGTTIMTANTHSGIPPKGLPKQLPKPSNTTPKVGVKAEPKIETKANTKAVQKIKSSESVFTIGDIESKTDEDMGSKLWPTNSAPPGQHVYDNCGFIIYCETHNRIAAAKSDRSSAVWLPFVSLSEDKSWKEGAIDGANLVLSGQNRDKFKRYKEKNPFTEVRCLHVFRIQLPQTQMFVTRLIFYIKLDPNHKEFKCCEKTETLRWLRMKKIIDGSVKHLWGPELCSFGRQVPNNVTKHSVNEYSLDQAFFYAPREPSRNLEEEMLKSCNITEKDVERLYGDFIEHCFPSFFLTEYSFHNYMSKYAFERRGNRLHKLFNAFNYNNNGFLTFHELLIGLASIEPIARNVQTRVKIIFRYYDEDRDAYLNENEFMTMFQDIKSSDKQTLELKAKESMKSIGLSKNGVSFEAFFKAVGSKKFRGTSDLCRSSKPIFTHISRALAKRSLRPKTGQLSLGSIVSNRKYSGVCDSCRERKYEYATHSVRMTGDGFLTDPQPLTGVTPSENSDSKTQLFSLRRHSIECVFNPKSVANFLIGEIRAFNQRKGTIDKYQGLCDDSPDKEGFVKKVELFCCEIQKMMSHEDRCVRVNSPVYCIGDIHGNLEDLLTMEKCLWKSIPIVSSNYVFLGDYVDRGRWGLECALYVFCLKMIAPNKITILRGNHEERALQRKYSYKNECIEKYGQSLGTRIWNATNLVFDSLPVCAVIDDSIYCSHGGIPCSTKLIDKINSDVPNVLKDPETESPIAWEILWSDPCLQQQFKEIADSLHIRVESTRGFLANTKRGTAYIFAEDAANGFLQNNGLTHIVRAHEVPADGYEFHFGKKCMTVFSCSHYCGNQNSAACIHIDNEKLRVVRLDTVNNSAATPDAH